QSVDKGELVFVVVPFNNNNLIGRCKIPIRNSGKIIKGQTTYLKIENYPYREWGMVKAEVESFSNIPGLDNEEYLVFLKIDNLTTSYGKKLEFNRELIGEAEIILEETTIIERIFYQFRHLWSI